MGYCVNQDCFLTFPTKNKKAIITALKELDNKREYSWVDKGFSNLDSFTEMMYEKNYSGKL